MILSHKIALDPNNAQATYFAKACGTARFAYNWALAEWQRQYEAWKLDNSLPKPSAYSMDNSLPKPSAYSMDRQLNGIKHEQFPWMTEVTKNATQKAILQLGEAINGAMWQKKP